MTKIILFLARLYESTGRTVALSSASAFAFTSVLVKYSQLSLSRL